MGAKERKTTDENGNEDNSGKENFPEAAAQGLESADHLDYQLNPEVRAKRAQLEAQKEAKRESEVNEEPQPSDGGDDSDREKQG